MLRLIKSNLATSGKQHLCDGTPARFLNVRALNLLLREGGHFGFQIVAQEIQFVSTILFSRVEGRFRRRQSKDQPAMTCIRRLESRTSRKNLRSASAFLLYTTT
jgi:hypothetical protein